jgi:putative ABC transport system ATP-binding protein
MELLLIITLITYNGRLSMKNIIETLNLRKSYFVEKTEIPVLKGINIQITEGEFVSIMGPSGSGKSTLLYLLGGIEKPTEGTVKIKNVDIASLSDKEISQLRRRDVGFIFQFYNLVPNLSVEENVMVPEIFDGKSPKQLKEKVEKILSIVGLADRKKYMPNQLSGGQQQRVSIARALLYNPGVIFADEPTGNLDSRNATEIMELFKKINKENGTTIVQVTHSEELAQYGSRIIYLKDGSVVNEAKVPCK